jgi:hypothetical protein
LPDNLALLPDTLLSSLRSLLDVVLVLLADEMLSPFINLLDDLTLLFDDGATSFVGLRRSTLFVDLALVADDDDNGTALLFGLRRSTLTDDLLFLSDADLPESGRSSSLDEPSLLIGDATSLNRIRSSSITLNGSTLLPARVIVEVASASVVFRSMSVPWP